MNWTTRMDQYYLNANICNPVQNSSSAEKWCTLRVEFLNPLQLAFISLPLQQVFYIYDILIADPKGARGGRQFFTDSIRSMGEGNVFTGIIIFTRGSALWGGGSALGGGGGGGGGGWGGAGGEISTHPTGLHSCFLQWGYSVGFSIIFNKMCVRM